MKWFLYKLDKNGEPVPEYDAVSWGKWFEDSHNERIVRQGTVNDVLVSTVFLGVDHSYYPDTPPVLWETMLFDNQGKPIGGTRRYSSKERAIQGHEETVFDLMGIKLPQKDKK